MRPIILLLLASSLLAATAVADDKSCQQWPNGLTFVGLNHGDWQAYAVTKNGQQPQKLVINSEVTTPVLSADNDTLFYMDDAAQISAFSLGSKKTTVLLSPSKTASYAQPEVDEHNNALYIVQLKHGKSVDTDILRLDLSSQTTSPLIIQRSAQFEPMLSTPWLYYSNVHCVLGCGKIIQEIWRYHLVSGDAEQITLLNSISRQPSGDSANQWLYFSSNAAGNYHIYRQSLTQQTSSPERLTDGAVTDISPAIADDRLYFIRQQAKGASLICRTAGGELHTLPLPKGVTQLRDLEI